MDIWFSYFVVAAIAGIALLVALLVVWVNSKKSLDNVKLKNDALISIIESSQQLGSSSSLEKVMGVVYKCIRALVDADTVAVYLVDDSVVEETSLVVKGVESADSSVFVNFNPDKKETCIGQVLQSRKSLIFEDFSKETFNEELIPRDKDFHSVMVAPLLFEDRAIGVVFVSYHQPGRYDQNILHFFELLCGQVALSVRNTQLQEGLSAFATRDSLSGLFTHGYFQEHLGKCLVKAKYAKEPVALMIIDVDNFKKINDNYGHPQGDALLKQLGGLIRSVVPSTDVVCRYGGDEFTVTMLNTDMVKGSILAEKIREKVEAYEFVLGPQIVHITVSGGVADFPEECGSKKELVRRADEALYEAKKAGRNKVKF